MKATETWITKENENLTAEAVYGILSRHNLLPESAVQAAAVCNAMSRSAKHFEIIGIGGEVVANVFVSDIIDGEDANLDLVPVAEHFRFGFEPMFAEAMAPIIDGMFSRHNLRRISAAVPYSRSRTKRALCSIGFKHEGRKEQGVRLAGEKPEDLRMLGLLREEHHGPSSCGSDN